MNEEGSQVPNSARALRVYSPTSPRNPPISGMRLSAFLRTCMEGDGKPPLPGVFPTPHVLVRNCYVRTTAMHSIYIDETYVNRRVGAMQPCAEK